MAIDLGETRARDTALHWAQDQLAGVLSVLDALDEPLAAAHVCQAIECAKSLLAGSERS